MAPFYGQGSTASRLQPLRGGSLLSTIQFPELSKQLDLECSKNFSSIFKQSIQTVLPISSKLSVMIGSEVVLFLTLT